MAGERCRDCQHSVAIERTEGGTRVVRYECRPGPPQVLIVNGRLVTAYPDVTNLGACQDYVEFSLGEKQAEPEPAQQQDTLNATVSAT